MDHDPQRDAFMRLFLSTEPKLFAFIRSLVLSRADADDVLQETALVLWEKFEQFEQGTHFDRWAYRVARLQVMCFRQKKARDRLQFSDALIEQLAEDMSAENDRIEARHDALTRCLRKLPDDDRQLIARRYTGRTTNRDVATATGRSDSAISRALNRIYTSLLVCIENTLSRPEIS